MMEFAVLICPKIVITNINFKIGIEDVITFQIGLYLSLNYSLDQTTNIITLVIDFVKNFVIFQLPKVMGNQLPR